MSAILSVLTTADTPNKKYVDDVYSTYLYDGNGTSQTVPNGLNFINQSPKTTLVVPAAVDGVAFNAAGDLTFARGTSPLAIYKNGSFQSILSIQDTSASWVGTCQDTAGYTFVGWADSASGINYMHVAKISLDNTSIVWQRKIRVSGYSQLYITDITTDSTSVIVCGKCGDNSSAFTSKIDAGTGNILWTHAQTQGGSAYLYGVTTDASGNIYSVGVIDNGTQYSRLVKMSASGTVLMEISYQGLIDLSAAVDATGNIYVAGRLTNSQKYYLRKLDSTGNLVWATGFTTTANQANGKCRVALGANSVALSFHETSINQTRVIIHDLAGNILQSNTVADTSPSSPIGGNRRDGVFFSNGFYYVAAYNTIHKVAETDAIANVFLSPYDGVASTVPNTKVTVSNGTYTWPWVEVADDRNYTRISDYTAPATYVLPRKSDGGLTWIKKRNSATSSFHVLFDTVRGVKNALYANTSGKQDNLTNGLTIFRDNGFDVGDLPEVNQIGNSYVAMAFKRATNFMDIVKYTGNGNPRSIPHNLGSTVGFMMVKRIDNVGDWTCWHRSLTDANYYITLNSTNPQLSGGSTFWNSTAPDSTSFYVGSAANVNAIGGEYVAYLFANDSSVAGMIQCGVYTGGMTRTSIPVSGTGSLVIPAGVTQLIVDGRGGTGGDNSYYIPAVDDLWSWNINPVGQFTTDHDPGYTTTAPTKPADYTVPFGTGTAQQTELYDWQVKTGPSTWTVYGRTYISYLKTAGKAEEYGGGEYYGQSTYVNTPNGGISFEGGLGGDGTRYIQTITLVDTGSDQTITYRRGSGGYLAIAYDVVTGSSSVDLGWELQSLWVKNMDAVADWVMLDTQRGMFADGAGSILRHNTNTEETYYGSLISVNSSGFSAVSADNMVGASGHRYMYVAFRRPNKPPKYGTDVFSTFVFDGGATPLALGANFSPDLILQHGKSNPNGADNIWIDKSRGFGTSCLYMSPASPSAEGSLGAGVFIQNGWQWNNASTTANGYGATYVTHMLKRAPEFMDIVCYSGTGAASQVVKHNLGVPPELAIYKSRTASGAWYVYSANLGITFGVTLNTTAESQPASINLWNYTAPTESNFTVGSLAAPTGIKCAAYLFASKDGVSKVGLYTGQASDQTINCGFTNGARYVLIKRTDVAGDWYVYDSVRGIIAGNDPFVLMNTTASEISNTNYIDPQASGFIVKSILNVAGGKYIYLAIA